MNDYVKHLEARIEELESELEFNGRYEDEIIELNRYKTALELLVFNFSSHDITDFNELKDIKNYDLYSGNFTARFSSIINLFEDNVKDIKFIIELWKEAEAIKEEVRKRG